MLSVLSALPKGYGPIKSISAPSEASVEQYGAFTLKIRVYPATAAALADLQYSFDGSKLTFLSRNYTASKSYLTLSLSFQAIGAPGKTSIRFFSSTKTSVKDTIKVTIKPVAVKSVSLDTASATMTVGDQLQLNATVLPENAASRSVKWSTSSKSIATVTSGGRETAKKSGKVTITATTVSGSKKAKCKIQVVKAAPTPKPTPTPTPMPDADRDANPDADRDANPDADPGADPDAQADCDADP